MSPSQKEELFWAITSWSVFAICLAGVVILG